MCGSHRALLGTVAAAHLLAAVVTWDAGVAIATPAALAVVAAAAVALGCTRTGHTGDNQRHPQLGRLRPVGRPAAAARRTSGSVPPRQPRTPSTTSS